MFGQVQLIRCTQATTSYYYVHFESSLAGGSFLAAPVIVGCLAAFSKACALDEGEDEETFELDDGRGDANARCAEPPLVLKRYILYVYLYIYTERSACVFLVANLRPMYIIASGRACLFATARPPPPAPWWPRPLGQSARTRC